MPQGGMRLFATAFLIFRYEDEKKVFHPEPTSGTGLFHFESVSVWCVLDDY